MKLSVVILNYNVRYFLEQCLRSVQKATEPLDAEIIVVDNDSKDDSCAMVKKLFPSVILIENKDNVGFSKANNQAVAIAKGDYVCILNPDTAVSEDTFTKTLHYAEKLPKMGALGVYLMDGTGNFLPESKRNLPTPKVSLLKLSGFSSPYYSNLDKGENGAVEVLVGAFMLMKRKVYEEVGGFDEDYFMYGEDIDLSYKITQAGYVNHYFGSNMVLHYKGESTQKDDVYFDRFYGAMQIFYKKHFHKNPLLEKAVTTGVAVAKKIQKARKGKKTAKDSIAANFVLVSVNKSLLDTLKAETDLDYELLSPEVFRGIDFSDSQIVFDADYCSYSEIFQSMTRLHNRNNFFRIKPPHCNFIIGSDQSDEKGGVIVFS